MPQLANILECGMLVTFGLAWPTNIRNSLRVKSSRYRNVHFLIIVIIGYLFGLAAKVANGQLNYVAIFYLANISMVMFDVLLWFHYRKLDQQKLEQAKLEPINSEPTKLEPVVPVKPKIVAQP
jgi:hypothetical protein